MRTAIVLALVASQGIARADSYAEEPTPGLAMPAAPLAGEVDGRVVATNPGGITFVRGAELALALDYEDDVATSSGRGVGLFAAFAGGGTGLLPRFGIGFGYEWLNSSGTVTPDTGSPGRLTVASGSTLGALGIGSAWHHYVDDGVLDGVDTVDLGLSARIGNRLALGGVVRDFYAQAVGGAEVRRRFELEAVVRPRGTEALELALGGRIGQERRDVDGWVRATVRVARGLFGHAAIESRETLRLVGDPATELGGRELRATVGVEVSFGALGVTALATGVRDDTGTNRPLGGQLVVRASAAGPASLLGRSERIERVELTGELDLKKTTAVTQRLRELARDGSARAVIVVFDRLTAGPATSHELRDELIALRRAGKKVFAHLRSGTQVEYFIASAADRVYLDPAVDVDLVGIAPTALYLRGALDKVDMIPQAVKIGEYKDAPEMITETRATPGSAKQLNELVDSIWDRWLGQVAESRKLTEDALRALVDRGPYAAQDLASMNELVDAVAEPEAIPKLIAAELGRMLPVEAAPAVRPDRWQHPRVAVIYIDGEIVRGKSTAASPIPLIGGPATVGDETIVAAIKAARASSRVGAIVLRINSPGGDSVASELIAREVFATRGKKPIVCSFGDAAASGGYFVAAGCDTIFSEPMTITGSIGVFTNKVDGSGLAKRLGITSETYRRGRNAGIYSAFALPLIPAPVSLEPWSREQEARLGELVRRSYERFVGSVAIGRKLTRDAVDAVGRGRVWSGSSALSNRLVDRLGGLGDALDEARRRMKLAPAARLELLELPKPPSLLDQLRQTTGEARSLPVRAPVIQARLPFHLVW